MTDIHTISFVVTKDHWPMLLAPHQRPHSNDAPRYSIRVPASVYPAATMQRDRDDGLGFMVGASSKFPPVLLIGDGTSIERLKWEDLVSQARRWRYPLNYLFWGRKIEVAVATYTMHRNQYHSGGTFLDLRGVKVHGGKFDEDEGLAAHIIEVKGWFDCG